jgi:phospholipid/cholesterol/gamma-HCH transport system substrate-binding protein
MPRTRSLAWSELKIGVLTIVALTIAAVLIFSLTGNMGFFWQRYPLKTRFGNVAGLAKGSPVRVAGVQVGSVTGVELEGDQVEIHFDVNKDTRSRITDKSVAYLGSVSLLGTSAVDITPATGGTPIPDNGYVPAGKVGATIGDVTTSAEAGIGELTGVLKDIRAGRGTVGKLMTDEQLYKELHAFVLSANDLTAGLQHGRGTLGRLLQDPKSAESLEASLKQVEEMTRRINAGEGSLGKLLNDDQFTTTLTSATANIRDLTDKFNKGDGTVGKLMNDKALYEQLTSVTNRFDALINQLNAGEGTAGRLLKDKQLYENMNGAVNDLRSLVAEIKKDPKKYLNVKVSIF